MFLQAPSHAQSFEKLTTTLSLSLQRPCLALFCLLRTGVPPREREHQKETVVPFQRHVGGFKRPSFHIPTIPKAVTFLSSSRLVCRASFHSILNFLDRLGQHGDLRVLFLRLPERRAAPFPSALAVFVREIMEYSMAGPTKRTNLNGRR